MFRSDLQTIIFIILIVAGGQGGMMGGGVLGGSMMTGGMMPGGVFPLHPPLPDQPPLNPAINDQPLEFNTTKNKPPLPIPCEHIY